MSGYENGSDNMNFTDLFNYDNTASFDRREVSKRVVDGVETHDFTFITKPGTRRTAYLIRPVGSGLFAATLYVHWYEPWSPTSNRRQFLDEARQLAQRGVVSLLIETMWSDDDWFLKRTQADDRQNSIDQVIELRRAMDFLLAQPDIDPTRVAYVGHDFGGMYGVLMGSVDQRPTCYVVMAATPRFPDWFLYYPALEGEPRQTFIDQMTDFDPQTHIARLAPKPVLFQFSEDDFHVPVERAQAFYDATADPKEMRWYKAGHGLNDDATLERVAWLSEKLSLSAL
jgi:dienelactone hydrolase